MSKIRNMTDKQPPSYPLRMPQELREQLTVVAKANNRSMNAEIIARLEQSLHESGSGSVSMRATTPTITAGDIAAATADLLGVQMRLEVAIASLAAQARISEQNLERAVIAAQKIKALLEEAETAGNSSQIRSLTSRLHEEEKWCRELKSMCDSIRTEMTGLQQQLAKERLTNNSRFALIAESQKKSTDH